jgi:DNA-binding MarR family transcriptional regulator
MKRIEYKGLRLVDQGFEKRYPGADALATNCAINLFVLKEQLEAFSQAFSAKYGIPSPAAFNVLAILDGAGEPLNPSVIAERMMVTRPTMTGTLGSMVARKLVTVRKHPTDGRMQLVELTDLGRQRVRKMRPMLHRAEKKWMSCLGMAGQRRLLRTLAKLQAHAPTT